MISTHHQPEHALNGSHQAPDQQLQVGTISMIAAAWMWTLLIALMFGGLGTALAAVYAREGQPPWSGG
ncbi:hypothetical protein FHR32_000842 [Streptosporangium album]|uniref:Uncharacterized protein n=1 Tax=Streptosporangium album TaxID=47479 RepID=A0A7W7W6R3_9ACTN|nr:hypothetical protein [Streptosporangium album]MBB4936537.1 hypothetical protein [Streptosporangium album]